MSYAILFVLLIPIGLILFVFFDLIVRLEHKYHTADWEKDQRHIGFFWRPRDAAVWGGSMARTRLASAWLFKTPVWVLADQKAMRLLFWYRVLWWISIMGWVAGVIYEVVQKDNR